MMSLLIAMDRELQPACLVSAGPLKRSKAGDRGDIEDDHLWPRKRALTASPERLERKP